MANLLKYLVDIEPCGDIHHWATIYQTGEHEVKLMAPQFEPYVKTKANAKVICKAVARPNM